MVTQGCIQEQAHKPQVVFAVEETLWAVGCTPKAAMGERLQLSPADSAGWHGTAWHSLAYTCTALPQT